MKKALQYMSVFAILLTMAIPSMAQSSREHIRTAIKSNGECRNVAITRTGGDLMLYGRNGYASKGCPSSLINKLSELHDDGEYIDDVQLTEEGSWLILYGDNGLYWNGIPKSLERKLREYNEAGEVINTVTFNDDGDWIIITDTKYSASDSDYLEWLRDGEDQHGELWTAHITDDALVAVYENGYKWVGNVPSDLKEEARTVEFDVYRLKFAGTAWFMADKKGHYSYNM